MHTLQKFCVLMLAGASTIAVATTSQLDVFGEFRASLNQLDDGLCAKSGGCATDDTQDGLSFRNNASVIGAKGSLTEGNTTGFFKYIMRTHNDEIFRDGALQTIIYEAGLSGKLGRISYGVGSTPYKASGMKLDPFWDTSLSARGFDGPGVGLSDLTWGFTKNLIKWQSDTIFGPNLQLFAAVIIDDSNADKHDLNLGMDWRGKSWSAGIQHLRLNSSLATAKSRGEGSFTRAWSRVKKGRADVALSVEQGRFGDLARSDENHLFIAVRWELNSKTRLGFSAGNSETDQLHLNGKGVSVGVYHDILSATEVYLAASGLSRRQSQTDRNIVTLGINHRLKLSFD